jgi:hypothetical protein
MNEEMIIRNYHIISNDGTRLNNIEVSSSAIEDHGPPMGAGSWDFIIVRKSELD